MPQILSEKDPKFGKTFLWSVTEDASFFRQALSKTDLQMDHICNWHPRRQLEWLSGRYLIHRYLNIPLSDLTVDQYGKPQVRNRDLHISISHTSGLVGVQFHSAPIGLDVQIETDKIHRVAHKFCAPGDYAKLGDVSDREETERITWSMKEAVFKAYGKGKLSYLNHILLRRAEKSAGIIRLEMTIQKEDEARDYVGRVRIIGPYCMSQVYEQVVGSE